jgi:vancomycin resistance protein YoaR
VISTASGRRAIVVAVSPRIHRPSLVAPGVGLGVVVLLVAAWAVDTAGHSAGVARNVALDGQAVGGLSRSDLSMAISELSTANESRPVVIETPAGDLETTADAIGLRVDEIATEQRALDAGRDGLFPLRPFRWFAALFADQQVPVAYRVDDASLSATVDDIAVTNRVEPKEPGILLIDDRIVATPGEAGQALPIDDLDVELIRAAERVGDPGSAIRIHLDPRPVAPSFSDADAQRVATEANALANRSLTVHVGSATTTVQPTAIRTWMRAVPGPDRARLTVAVDPNAVRDEVTRAVGEIGVPPVELSWSVRPDGSVTYAPGTNGTKCCAPDSSQRVIDALRGGLNDVTLDLTVATPQHDATWAEEMNIHQAIASFTTPHACCESRVKNIHRISDLVRGTVIAPGETLSVNELVGRRTALKGFVEAGVIYDGSFSSDVGGGVSQFATTLFNAAFFGGLDLVEYQAHTIYISRYPYGREATLSFPEPDLKIRNTTPFGILVWPTYTGSSVTVTLYSSPWVAGEQTGQVRESSGACTRVRTQRTRTWLIDGRQEIDTVSALYQPAEGVLC